jgi:hypothetical protein
MDGLDRSRLEWHRRIALARGQDANRCISPNQHTLPALQDPVKRTEDCPRFDFPRHHDRHEDEPVCRYCGHPMEDT